MRTDDSSQGNGQCSFREKTKETKVWRCAVCIQTATVGRKNGADAPPTHSALTVPCPTASLALPLFAQEQTQACFGLFRSAKGLEHEASNHGVRGSNPFSRFFEAPCIARNAQVQLDIRTGHAHTVEKVLGWVDEEGGVRGTSVCDCGCGTGSLAIPLALRVGGSLTP